jgi:thiamine-monophosphate kinase
MDVSDGLVADLAHLCEASGCGAQVQVTSVPLSEGVADLVAETPSLLASALTGGDDYELLVAVPPDRAPEMRDAAKRAGVPVSDIGVFTASSTIDFVDRDGQALALERQGFTHF